MLLAWIVLTFWPVSYGVTRLAQVLLVLGLWAGALFLWWKVLWFRGALITAALFCIGIAVSPGRTESKLHLRKAYVEELQKYDGTRYVWGGETGLGIDCSGLVRRAMLRCLLREGVTTANPVLVRRAALLWWYDSSARALASGYREETKQLSGVDSINGHSYPSLLPGDFAITADGIHALAYLGEGQWIEADPAAGKVIKLAANTTETSRWLNVPVTFVRWQILEE